MKLSDIKTQCYILAMIIRDDGQRFLLGSGGFEFSQKQLHFPANKVVNDTVDVHGGDGTLLAGQVRRASKQKFEGVVGAGTSDYSEVEGLRRSFFAFFRKNHFYEVVYVMPDGTAIKRQRGYIEDAPEIKELYQLSPEWSIAFNFEDVNYYRYYEDASGNELYGNSAQVLLYNAVTGGLQFDGTGAVWDGTGAVWLDGTGGTTTLKVNSIDYVYPLLTIRGPALNPRLENLTTGDTIAYDGNVAEGQVLELDMLNQTALLNGTNVLPNVSGLWINFAPGNNRINYITDNNNAFNATISWPEVVG